MTREDIIRMAREAGFSEWAVQTPKDLERFAALVAAAEREACAQAAEDRKHLYPEIDVDHHYNQACTHCAAAIRARGKK